MSTYLWDVSSIRTRLENRLKAKASWAEILYFSANLRLIDAFAEEMSDLAGYSEFWAREAKWSLARQRSSLLASQAVHKYDAHRKIGAFGTIRVGVSDHISSSDWSEFVDYDTNDVVYYDDILYIASASSGPSTAAEQPDVSPTYWDLLDISPSVNVDIPKWTVFSDETGDYKFTTYSAENLTVGQNFIDIDVVQGTPKSYTFTASGISNEEFLITDDSIENYRYELYVNNVLWTKVSNRLDYTATDTVYEIENLIDFTGLYLKFGNDVYGKKLSNGDSVKFYCITTKGDEGNVSSSNLINVIDSTLYDSNGDIVEAFCTNRDSLTGGSLAEDTESIRLNAPKIFQTGDRASAGIDYKTIIERDFSFVLKAIVWGAYETNLDNGDDPWTFVSAEENVVHVAAISQSEENLTTAQKLLVSQGINTYKSPTDIVTYEVVEFLNLAFRVTAYVADTSYTLSSVTNGIRTALAASYSVSALELNQNIYFSDYQTLIDSVAGVEHHSSYAEIFYDSLFTDAYTCSLTIPSESLKASSIRVYIQDTIGGQTTWTLLATDNGAGGFTAATGYTLSSASSVDYTTGTAVLIVSSGLTPPHTNYTLRAFWRLASDDLLLRERNQIFKYSSAESTVTATYLRS